MSSFYKDSMASLEKRIFSPVCDFGHSRTKGAGCWFNWDVSGLTLISSTWVFLGFACFVTNYFIVFTWFAGKNSILPFVPITDGGLTAWIIYHTLMLLTFWSHWNAILTAPGVISQFEAKEGGIARWCKKCKANKPDRAHHCKVCDRCIFRMDHHCPWINNCVGFMNQRLFILFLAYVAILSIYTLLMVLYVSYCWCVLPQDSPYSAVGIVCVVLLVTESGFFLFFVSDFLTEQIEAIDTNSTLVETYQHKRGRQLGSFWAHWYEVMGDQWWLWWLPMANWMPMDLHEPIEKDETPEDQRVNYTPKDVDDIGVLQDGDSPTDEEEEEEEESSEDGDSVKDALQDSPSPERENGKVDPSDTASPEGVDQAEIRRRKGNNTEEEKS